MSDLLGTIFNIQRFCTQDGPGIRTTVFLKGCPLRCAWCHNPESQRGVPELLFSSEKCIGCGSCVAACPNGLHTLRDGTHCFTRNGCISCGKCTAHCWAEALELCGKKQTVAEVMDEASRDRPFYETSGGGITLSGGEPLAQGEFTLALAQSCKQENIPLCIETCGYGDPSLLTRLIPLVDIFLFDIKLLDAQEHKKYTGVDNILIQQNLRLLSQRGARIILRCPIIPDVNQTPAFFDGLAELAAALSGVEAVHLEPYHPLGLSKLQRLGRQADYDRPTILDRKELIHIAAAMTKKSGKPVIVQ